MFDNNHYHIQCDLRYHKLDFQYASSTCSTFTKGAHEDFEYYKFEVGMMSFKVHTQYASKSIKR